MAEMGGAARSLQDIVGGIVLVAIGMLALYLVRDLPAVGRVGFASGTAPRIFAYGLIGLGGAVAVLGWLNEGPSLGRSLFGGVIGALVFALVMVAADAGCDGLARLTGIGLLDRLSSVIGCLIAIGLIAWINGFPSADRFGLQGPLAILGAIVLFAVMVRDFGLAITGIPMVLLATAAAPGYRWLEAIVFALGITLFCALLFPIGLGQPIPLWPTF